MGCVSSRDTENSTEREKGSNERKWQCASSRRNQSKPMKKKKRKKPKKPRKKKGEDPRDAGEREAAKKSSGSRRSRDAPSRKVEGPELEPSGTSLRSEASKTSKKSRKSLEPSKSTESRSSAGVARGGSERSTRKIARDESKHRQRSDDKMVEQQLFFEPKEVFFVSGTPSNIGTTSSTKSIAKSSKSRTSRMSEGASPSALTIGNRKSSGDRRPGEPRASTSGCSGTCSQLRSNVKYPPGKRMSGSIERSSSKCQRPSRVKIELCEPAPKIRRPKGSRENDEEDVNKISKFADEVVSTIKKNCKRLKGRVFPVLKKKSRTALSKVKKGCRNLSESQFFMRKKNCDLDGCGSGTDDCTSRTSAPSRKSLTSIASGTERRRKKTPKAIESPRDFPSDCDELQICECDDNPNKSLNGKTYSICCCTEVDSSGNKIKKGCC